MNLIDIITSDVAQLLQIPITGIVIWFFSKRHFQKKDLKDRDILIESNQANVISQNLGLYQTMIDDIKVRYNNEIKEAYIKIESLEEIIIELRNANKMLDAKLYSLSNQLINIKGELENYEKNNNN